MLHLRQGVIDIRELFHKNIDLSQFQPFNIKCEECCGLCCIALYFSKTEGFPENKDAGIPCKNLLTNYKCKIHPELSDSGLKGCSAYDCFGAGQQVTSLMQKKPEWNTIAPEEKSIIFNAFLKVMQIHHTLWYLTEALTLNLSTVEKGQLELLRDMGKKLTAQPIEELQNIDIISFQNKGNQLLKLICQEVGTMFNNKTVTSRNYIGKSMKGKNLTGQDFSMSLLIAASLEQSDLYGANFLGADMRDTNIRNTDLSHCLFLNQMQINAAKGNKNTALPPYLSRPSIWND